MTWVWVLFVIVAIVLTVIATDKMPKNGDD
jgi:preprotein translocase subunit SecG